MLSKYTSAVTYAAHLFLFTLCLFSISIFHLVTWYLTVHYIVARVSYTLSHHASPRSCPVVLCLFSWPWAVDEKHIWIQLMFEPLFLLLVPNRIPSSENLVNLWGLLSWVSPHFTLYHVEGSKLLNKGIILWDIRSILLLNEWISIRAKILYEHLLHIRHFSKFSMTWTF